MLVWGGFGDSFRNTGGRYALGQSLDGDGDGVSACAGDCDDTNPSIHPGASEACNGRDDNCSGEADEGFDADFDGHPGCGQDCDDSDGQIWAAPATVGQLLVSPASLVSWNDLAGVSGPGTSYDLASGSLASTPGIGFASASCLQTGGPNSYPDSRPAPTPGHGFWYLARGRNACGLGSFGSAARDLSIPACP
jgi:hypothetical protein